MRRRLLLGMILGGLGAGSVRADVLPPPVPLTCGPGEDIETSHSGQHCAARPCASTVVCPPGWDCTPREEANCDPRGGPCDKFVVTRCQKASRPQTRCPQTASPDPKRTNEVETLLKKQPQGQELFQRVGRPLVVCYGDVREGVVQDDDLIVIQRDRTVPAQAARLAHLLAHLVWWPPFPKDQIRASHDPCPAVAATAMENEARAARLENELRTTFRLAPLPDEDLQRTYEQRCRELRK